jgi:phosphohistidine swiveling domain-containing protein
MSVVEEVIRINWLERWAGSYTFISCSYWGEQYFHSLMRELGIQFDHALFVHREGTVSFFVPKEEYERFGKNLALQATQNPTDAEEKLKLLCKNSDLLTAVMGRLSGRVPSQEEYREFLKYFDMQLPYHNFMKKTVDFLPTEAQSLLGLFKEARIYSEHVYSSTELFFRGLMRIIAEKEGRDADALTCLTRSEFEKYLEQHTLPDEDVLRSRFRKSALYFENGIQELIGVDDAATVEKALYRVSSDISELTGVGVFTGVVKGVTRIVTDPHNPGQFENGNILVTGMTRPEFMPLIKKAGAIVTDVGGVLCHAAITARELQKPCVVGTHSATRILKDGDIVEVDAEKGIVRKI